jgi:hypothetical protein
MKYNRRFVVTCLLLAPAMSYGNEDLIAAKLQKSIELYEAAIEKNNAAVIASFDKREADARRKGDRAQVDQVSKERIAFHEKNIRRQSLPKSVTTRFIAARSELESAYETAIKNYTKANEDEKALATQEELNRFLRGSNIPEDATRFRVSWFNGNRSFAALGIVAMWWYFHHQHGRGRAS